MRYFFYLEPRGIQTPASEPWALDVLRQTLPVQAGPPGLPVVRTWRTLAFEQTAASAGHRRLVTQSALHDPGIDSAAVAQAELGHLQPEARGQGGNADIEREPVAEIRALEGALGTINTGQRS